MVKLRRFLLMDAILLVALFLFSCAKSIQIESISIDSNSVLLEYEQGTFDIENLIINVTNNDGSVLQVIANESMISSEDLDKLSTVGEHLITLTYLSFSTTITITIRYDDFNEQLHGIYLLAYEADVTDMTYEEWLETIRGAAGSDGREIELRVTDTFIQWRYTGDDSWVSLIEIAMLIGQKGEQGLSAYEIYLQYHPEYTGDEETWINDLVKGFLSLDQQAQVIFQLDGGIMPNDEPLLQEIQLLTSLELPIPTKDGYIFLGWYTGNTINDIQFNNYTIFSRDTILYARWGIADFEITLFDGDDELFSSVESFGTSISGLYDTEKIGSTFLGWYTDINFLNSFTGLTVPDYDLVLYGLWQINSYEITFITHNDQIIEPLILQYEDVIPELISLTDDEYRFMGWYLDESLTESFEMITMPNFDLTLYARWENNFGEVIDFSELFPQKTELTVWFDDEAGDYMASLIAEFNKIYPNIMVEHQHMGSVDARALLKIYGPSGNGADVFQFPHDHLALSILQDLVLPLPSSTKTLLEGMLNPVSIQMATVSFNESMAFVDPSQIAVGGLYAVPMSLESIGLFYNTDLVAGTPRTTYEGLLAEVATWNAQMAADYTGRTNAEAGLYGLATSSHWADSYFMQHIYSAFGFLPFGTEVHNPPLVGYESSIPALNWMVNSLKPMVTGLGSHNSVTGNYNFEAGLIPYIIAGPWNHEAYKAAGINYKVVPMPTINGIPTQTFAGAQMAAVYKYSDNTEDAIKFVEFLASEVAMQLMYDMKGKLPALNENLLGHIDGLIDNDLLLAMAEQLMTSVAMPTIPQVPYYWGPGEMMIINIWNNGATPFTAATTATNSYRLSIGLTTG